MFAGIMKYMLQQLKLDICPIVYFSETKPLATMR